MARLPTVEELGEPALRLEGLQLWVHGYEFPQLTDYWDGNWLRVTAHCGAAGASVWVSGALVRNVELSRWAAQCDALRDGTANVSELAPLEPALKLAVRPTDGLGHLSVRVERDHAGPHDPGPLVRVRDRPDVSAGAFEELSGHRARVPGARCR